MCISRQNRGHFTIAWCFCNCVLVLIGETAVVLVFVLNKVSHLIISKVKRTLSLKSGLWLGPRFLDTVTLRNLSFCRFNHLFLSEFDYCIVVVENHLRVHTSLHHFDRTAIVPRRIANPSAALMSRLRNFTRRLCPSMHFFCKNCKVQWAQSIRMRHSETQGRHNFI